LNALLDITGHEIYSTVVTSLREIIVTVVVLLAAIVAEPSLQDAASLMLGILILCIFWNVGYIAGRGWWRKYYSGMVYTFALRVSTFLK
jgi:glycerol uptake facilitator-like aquaporin